MLFSAVCATFVAAWAGIALLIYQATVSIGDRVAELVPRSGTAQHRACQRAPETWRLDTPFAVVDGYDLETGTSPNPRALPLDHTLFLEIQAGAPRAGRHLWTGPYGGVLLLAIADKGPCSLFQAHVPRMLRSRNQQLFRLGLVLCALVGLTSFVGTGIAVRPLVRRIERIRDAARRIGQEQRYVSASDPAADPLGELGRQVDQAHAELADAHRQLRDRARALEEHLATVAHDLRTPMASLQMAIEHAGDAPPDHAEALLGQALSDVVYLDALVENLGMEVRFRQQAPVDPLWIDLREVVERVARRFALLGQRRGVVVDYSVPDEPLNVSCDPVAVEQAISNIVHNSVAHGHPGGHVAVVLDHKPPAEFELRVADDGPGVPAENLESLGRRAWSTGAPRPKPREGFGLGLAISQAVCQAADWALEFEPGSQHGLTVRIRGPRGPAKNQKIEPRP